MVLVSGTNPITAAVHGNTAVITPRGHAGEEIEGRVQSVNTGAGSLVVLDQRLGTVTITTNGTTLIRRGNTTIPLFSLGAGMSVHVKAMLQSDSTYLATEILLQDENVGGEREVEGTVRRSAPTRRASSSRRSPDPSRSRPIQERPSRRPGATASFSDVAVGAMVEAEGSLPDGSILARKVTIE